MNDGPGGIGGGVTPAPKIAEAAPAPAEAVASAAAPTMPHELAEAMGLVQHNFETVSERLQQRAEHATQLEQAIIADRQNIAGLYQQVQQLGTLVKHVNSRFGALEMAIKAAANNKKDAVSLVKEARTFLAFVDEMPAPPAQPLPGETPPNLEDEFGVIPPGPDKVTH